MTRDFEILFAQNWIEQNRIRVARARLTSYSSARSAVFCANWRAEEQCWADRYEAFATRGGIHNELVR